MTTQIRGLTRIPPSRPCPRWLTTLLDALAAALAHPVRHPNRTVGRTP